MCEMYECVWGLDVSGPKYARSNWVKMVFLPTSSVISHEMRYDSYKRVQNVGISKSKMLLSLSSPKLLHSIKCVNIRRLC